MDTTSVSEVDPESAGRGVSTRRRGAAGVWLSIGVCVALVAAAELAFRRSGLMQRLASENQYIAKASSLSESREGADVAITGDSRTLHGVNPFVVESAIRAERGETLRVYNAGLSGAPPMTQLAMIRRLLTHPHAPRLVVMSLSPYMFSSKIYRPTARESLTTIYRLRDLGSAFRAGATAEDLATIFASNVLELLRYRPRLLATWLRDERPKPKAQLGKQGFIENGEGDPKSQAARGASRAKGYRTEMWKPKASFGNEHMGFFVEALRELHEAGVRTLVLSSQSASQIELAYGPNSIYGEHMRWVAQQTSAFGVPFLDVKQNPAVSDEDYIDGDHLGGNGAARFSAWLAHEHLIPALGGRKSDRPPGCRTVFDFEAPLEGWQLEGDAFASPLADQSRRRQRPSFGYTGHRFLTTFGRSGEAATGMAASPPFPLDAGFVRIRVAGGKSEAVGVALVAGGAQVAVARGQDDETFRDVAWDVRSLRGQSATLRITDEGAGRNEHVQIDDVATCP